MRAYGLLGYRVMTRVLIVDDQPEHAEIVSLLLVRRGYEVAIAGDGPSAIIQARARPPDLVLLDLYMPAVDGISTAVELRGDERTARIPILFISASGEDGGRARLVLGEPVCVLPKPFRAAELIGAVEHALGRARGALAPVG
jgi:CheY-like chemotaxis protein